MGLMSAYDYKNPSGERAEAKNKGNICSFSLWHYLNQAAHPHGGYENSAIITDNQRILLIVAILFHHIKSLLCLLKGFDQIRIRFPICN